MSWLKKLYELFVSDESKVWAAIGDAFLLMAADHELVELPPEPEPLPEITPEDMDQLQALTTAFVLYKLLKTYALGFAIAPTGAVWGIMDIGQGGREQGILRVKPTPRNILEELGIDPTSNITTQSGNDV